MECEWCWWLQVGLVVYLVVQLIRLLLADCDLSLQWADKFGKQPGSLVRKVVWITGASGGIGEHLAYELAKNGCRLVLSARRKPELERVRKNCLAYGALTEEDVLVLQLDMLKFDDHKPAVDQVLDKFKQIDILVNNAGRGQRASWEDVQIDVDRALLELNVFSVVSLTRLVLPSMLARKQGHIAVTSSVAGKLVYPKGGSYCGSKHAIQGYFAGLRSEVHHKNIKVTVICPGPVFSSILEHAFTNSPDKELGVKMKQTGNKIRMVTSRCARLMAVALANQLKEVWISTHPVLMTVYLNQYFPVLYGWVTDHIAYRLVERVDEQ